MNGLLLPTAGQLSTPTGMILVRKSLSLHISIPQGATGISWGCKKAEAEVARSVFSLFTEIIVSACAMKETMCGASNIMIHQCTCAVKTNMLVFFEGVFKLKSKI